MVGEGDLTSLWGSFGPLDHFSTDPHPVRGVVGHRCSVVRDGDASSTDRTRVTRTRSSRHHLDTGAVE